MIEAGTYTARALEAEFGKTPDKGTRFIRVRFKITGPSHVGQTIPWDGWLTAGAIDRTLESLMIAGYEPGTPLKDLKGLGRVDTEIVVEHEQVGTRTFARVRWVNRPSSRALRSDMVLVEADKAKLDDEFADAMLALMDKKQKAEEEDDIPF